LKVIFKFQKEIDPTIEDFFRKQPKVDNKVIFVEIMDTVDPEEFNSYRDSFMRNCNAFIIVFSLTSKKSFDDVVNFYEQALRVI
jgi:GTPase KRas protein